MMKVNRFGQLYYLAPVTNAHIHQLLSSFNS